MSNYIVLVKQVPDVTQITGNALDPETGTLKRGVLPSVINKLDTDALAFASKMRQISPGKIVCLTMGPPMAKDILIYSLTRCADSAVLLTDKALGGADTPATANPLAYAIRRIVRDMFSGNDDYAVIAGMQSVDGDTAQVPPQVAEELQIPCIAYATDVEFIDDKFRIKKIVAGGNQWVIPKTFPYVITIANYEYPLFASFQRSRWANKFTVTNWSAEDIKPTLFGANGSKTRVIRVFPPPKSARKNKQIFTIDEFVTELMMDYKKGGFHSAFETEGTDYVLPSKRAGDPFNRDYEFTDKEMTLFKKVAQALSKLGVIDVHQLHESLVDKIQELLGEKTPKRMILEMFEGYKITQPAYAGDVWVIAEHDGEKTIDVTSELLGKANSLAKSLQVKVGAVIAGHTCRHMSDGLVAAGADDVHVIEDELLKEFRPVPYRKVIAEVIEKHNPQIVLFGATPQGRVLAPMVAYRLGCGLTADCTGLDIRDNTRRGAIAILMQTRPALGGNVMATICTINSQIQMATARPGVMKRMKPEPSRKGNIIEHRAALSESDIDFDIVSTELSGGSAKLTTADVIVSGGKGLRNRDTYNKLVSDLSIALQEKLHCQVERGASRAAVEHGFIDRIHQVGQTGTAVSPKLYIALGISGAIQHLIGIENAGIIVAVNSDPQAPIFKHSDYYIIGNAEEIVPKIIEALR
ncbi:MAG: electron transfer flavoprotein subunit beta [Candidatus Brocadia sp. AMX2]|nr:MULTISPECIES: FAD-binding protein [Brocadia]MBC6930982.1 electron transfer flavoprotein subunit beta [Candidatus Brocadia sp.]MBL1167972.1 electron transfer flavoprotein subunit beta [Candidatus Brocadia sp. AMX1]MCK6419272.1 FAD-binding protein [Alphaproteobacteria bacterium]NOG41467.1 electron transfer flavoprotein subunit beta [Planctomycetota bacterium]KAA0245309.1 MAG: electron transfer flavoprotein subunit beta [Candidatus Brocadia sp. AMX2]